MLRFLSSLFTKTAERAGGLDEALIAGAIERVVAGTDQRIRAIGPYRKRLRQPVEQAIIHVISLVDALPSPVEITRNYLVRTRVYVRFLFRPIICAKFSGVLKRSVTTCRI